MDNILFEVQLRALCDYIPPTTKLDALFLYGQTPDNEEAVFRLAAEQFAAGKVEKILLIRTGPLSGYAGYEHCLQELEAAGVPPKAIEGVACHESMLHTLIESEAMVAHAQKQHYRTLAVCAAPFQQTRAFMTAISVALKKMPVLKVYSIPGKPLDWLKEAAHSQGTLMGSRIELIYAELERIPKYQQKGDLAPTKAVIEYLNNRA